MTVEIRNPANPGEIVGTYPTVTPDDLPKLMNAVPEEVARLVYLSSHGVERTDKMPFVPQNYYRGP